MRASQEHWCNPSSPYRSAARAHLAMEDARALLAEKIGTCPERLVFTSGATEANNAVFSFFARLYRKEGRVAISAVEHPCVVESAHRFFANRVEVLPVNSEGTVKLGALQHFLDCGEARLVSIMAANNETGVLQPWQEAGILCRKAGVPFHCDAAQWLGKMPLDGMGECDFLTGCAHKFGGPRGVGFLKISEAWSGLSEIVGGQQENGHRGGTENVPGIVAMADALNVADHLAQANRSRNEASVQKFCVRMEAEIGARVLGAGAPKMWNTVSLLLPEGENVRWVRKLDRRGFAVSTGSACATGKEGPSHVLAAMDVDAGSARRVVRVSGGWETTQEQWQELAEAFCAVYAEIREGGDEPGGALTEVIEV